MNLEIAGRITANTAVTAESMIPASVALSPDDFPGLSLKPVVKEGDSVRAGDPILQDKKTTDIKICAPATGTVKSIIRGDRRKLEFVVIDLDKTTADASNNPAIAPWDINNMSADEITSLLQTSGLWAFMRQRPYNIVASPNSKPRDIFVSTFDTNPLAPDLDELLKYHTDSLTAGVNVLSKLTTGKVYVARRGNGIFPDINGAVMIDVEGPHPAGNVGVQIANIKPVNKGETVWTLDGTTLARIGELALQGFVTWETTVAITGSEIQDPSYVKTIIGADIASLIDSRIRENAEDKRIISGNVLTGTAVTESGYLRYPYHQITVIPEGDDKVEFMGWASLSPNKMSTSRSFPGHFLRKIFNPDARLLGGRRAMIMSGEYDRMLPMDIMTEYLVKATLSHNIEQMEQLGIYEVAPEDVALAEYVCTSKMPLQSIIADGLEYLRKELE